MFTLFSRSFFDRLFAQQFVEKAEIHADLARGVMDDFLSLQGGEPGGPTTPPEDLVLLLSNTIGNDVNLYRDGRLAASSRREFFDAGILPELLDGEVYYRLREMNDPSDAQDRRIGLFTLRTLTVPYTGMGARYFLSLPFPFERQDIANAGQELIEFLVFISVFFIALVLLLARGIGASIVTPVRRLLAGTREATLGNLEIELAYDRNDEMKTLVDGFNAMIRSLKEHQQELAELGKKAAWAEMARKVAHEIKNPLTPIQLSAEHILRVFEDGRGDFEPALRESISYIVSEVENLRRIAQEFLEISREPLPRREPFGLDELVRETVEPYRKLLAERIVIREDYRGADFVPDRRPGQDEDRPAQPPDQRHRIDPWARRDPGLVEGRPEEIVPDHRRHRRGHGAGRPGAGLRALFLDQGRGDRAGSAHRQEDRRRPRRDHRGFEPARPGDLHRPALAASRELEIFRNLWKNTAMNKTLVTYFTRTGNTRAVAEADLRRTRRREGHPAHRPGQELRRL